MEKYLTPLKPLHYLDFDISIATFDVETKDGLRGCKLFCWSLAFFDQGRNNMNFLHNSTNLQPLFDFILRYKSDSHRTIVIFIHNMSFDIRFIVEYCWTHQMEYNCYLSGSNMICLTVLGYNVKFVDTLQFLKQSQEKCEIQYKIDEMYTKINCKPIFDKEYSLWTFEEKLRVHLHNINDVSALLQIMKECRKHYLKIGGVDLCHYISMAKLGMSCLRVTLNENIFNPFIYTSKNHYEINEELDTFIRKGYFGGRTETFNTAEHSDVICLDINSLYPFVLYTQKFPVENGYWTHDIKQLSDCVQYGLGFIECNITIDQSEKIPILPQRIDNKLMFTTCKKYHCVYSSIELRYCLQRNEEVGREIYSIQLIRGYIWNDESLSTPFKRFVDIFYGLKKVSDGGARDACKYILNTPTGKFGQKFTQKEMKIKFYMSEREAPFNDLTSLYLEL